MRTGSSLSSSPVRSSSSTMVMTGGNVGPSSSIAVDDFNIPTDLVSIQDLKDEALQDDAGHCTRPRLAKLKVNSKFKAPCKTSILYPVDGGNTTMTSPLPKSQELEKQLIVWPNHVRPH